MRNARVHPQLVVSFVAVFMLASCLHPKIQVPELPDINFDFLSPRTGGGSSTSPTLEIFDGLNDSNSNNSIETAEIDVFENSSLIVTVHLSDSGFAVSQHYANFSGSVPNLHDFLDIDETWAGNMQLSNPVASSLFPGISQASEATNITRSDTATYQGIAMGTMRVSGTRKLLVGASSIDIDFDDSSLDLLVGMAAFDSDEIDDPSFTETDAENLVSSNAVYITAEDIGFGTNGRFTGSPEFTNDRRTVGTAVPLEDERAALEGEFRGPAGEILILHGETTKNSDSLIWGMIANEEP